MVGLVSWSCWDGMGRNIGRIGIRHFLSYPPTWTAAGIAFLLIAALLPNGNAIQSQLRIPSPDAETIAGWFGLAPMAVIAIAAGCSFGLGLLERHRHDSLLGFASRGGGPQQADDPSPFATFESLCQWLATDQPVEDIHQDVFGHARIARRIAERITAAQAPSQAVVGGLGTGKTTLFHLVEAVLEREQPGCRVRMVRVELWPFETPRAAVRGVVAALVDALGREADTIALRGLPSRYTEAMDAAGGIWSALAHFHRAPGNPLDTLEGIDQVAQAIGLRFVVWVEDLERFAAEIEDHPAIRDESLRVAPILALLHGLDELGAITVITATTTLQLRLDLDKIARYVERIPALEGPRVGQILAMFRQGCWERHPGLVDPVLQRDRGGMELLEHLPPEWQFDELETYGFLLPSSALAMLATSPRVMKQGLRKCLELWDRLPGEMSFDNALAASILKEGCPAAFALVDKHSSYLRASGELGRGFRPEKGKFQVLLGELGLDPRMYAAVFELVKFMFGDKSREDGSQGFAITSFAGQVYWERFLAEPVLDEEEKDQPVLKCITSGTDQELMDLLEASRRWRGVHEFRHLLGEGRTFQLLVPLVKRRILESPETWERGERGWEVPGLTALGAVWPRMRGDEPSAKVQRVLGLVKESLALAIPRNLEVADAISHIFLTRGKGESLALPDEERVESQIFQWDTLTETCEGHPELLAAGLRGARSEVLYCLCWGYDRIWDKSTEGLPFAQWERFSKTILDGAEQFPDAMVPQLAEFLTRRRGGPMDDLPYLYYEFDLAVAERLFGGIARLAGAVGKHSHLEWSDYPAVQAVFKAIEKD